MQNTEKTIKFNPPPLNMLEVFNACASLIKNEEKTRTDKNACLKYLDDVFCNRSPNVHLDFNDGSGPNWSPLMVACYYNFKEGVKKLIELGADPNFANFSDGKTPLEVSAVNTNLEITELLLNANADVNANDKHGKNLLLTAIECTGKKADKYLEALLSKDLIDVIACTPENTTVADYADKVGNINGSIILNNYTINKMMENSNPFLTIDAEEQEFDLDFDIKI